MLARCKGVLKSSSYTFNCALCFKSIVNMFEFPRNAAMCIGLLEKEVLDSTFAFY